MNFSAAQKSLIQAVQYVSVQSSTKQGKLINAENA